MKADTIILNGQFDFPGTTMTALAQSTVTAAQSLYGKQRRWRSPQPSKTAGSSSGSLERVRGLSLKGRCPRTVRTIWSWKPPPKRRR